MPTIINLLLSLIFELDFVISMDVQEKAIE